MTEHTKQQAMQYLDDMYSSDPRMSRENMVDNVAIQFGCTWDEADEVYREWLKVVTA